MRKRFILITGTLIASGAIFLGACSNENAEEENASIVNVEKGVAPPVAISETNDPEFDNNGMVQTEPAVSEEPNNETGETELQPQETADNQETEQPSDPQE